jgi:hypothetical protein
MFVWWSRNVRFYPESHKSLRYNNWLDGPKTDIPSAACWTVKYVADPSSEACYRSE